MRRTARSVAAGARAKTRYKKQERTRFEITHCVALERLDEEDGVFPLVSNDLRMTKRELLLSYKHQPSDCGVASSIFEDGFTWWQVYLKEASRIQALLCVYFVALLVSGALLERELVPSCDGAIRAKRRIVVSRSPVPPPTARKLIDLFEDVQRHTLTSTAGPPVVFTTELTRLQRKVLRLLGMPDAYDF